MADRQNTPPHGPAGTRPAGDGVRNLSTDWQVIDQRNGEVIAVKYEPTSIYDDDGDAPLSAKAEAMMVAGELNAWAMGGVGCGYCMTCGYGGYRSPECLHKQEPDTGALCEKARQLRIEGVCC